MLRSFFRRSRQGLSQNLQKSDGDKVVGARSSQTSIEEPQAVEETANQDKGTTPIPHNMVQGGLGGSLQM